LDGRWRCFQQVGHAAGVGHEPGVLGQQFLDRLQCRAQLGGMLPGALVLPTRLLLGALSFPILQGWASPYSLNANLKLAAILRAEGSVERAQSVIENVIDIVSQLPEDQQLFWRIAIASAVAATFREAGRLREAERWGEFVLAEQTQLLGPQHSFTIAAMMDLARTLELENKDERATALRTEAVSAAGPELAEHFRMLNVG
jgi:hypothetical protein